MHNFIYPVQNSYITNESGYANSNFSLDSILEVKAVNQLTQFTANIRKLRLPDPYKGKGIRFKGQVIPLKIGKKKS